MLCPVWAYIKHENHSKLINPNIYIYIYMVFTTEGLLEVAIESWPKWDLNPRPLIYIYIYIYIYIHCPLETIFVLPALALFMILTCSIKLSIKRVSKCIIKFRVVVRNFEQLAGPKHSFVVLKKNFLS